MQKIIVFSQTICYSKVKVHPYNRDQFYDVAYFVNEKAFTMEPMEEVILMIQGCGDYWMRKIMDCIKKFKFPIFCHF